jgi:nucleotide-binding universal stress UspA family protein
MGYYTSLIQRKFKDLVGTRYEEVRQEYSDFLVSEEEMKFSPVRLVLVPIDILTGDLPLDLVEIFLAYGARVHLAYIMDASVLSLLDEMVGKESEAGFRKVKEKLGQELLDTFSRFLEDKGLAVQTSLFSGSKIEDVIRLSHSHDLIAIYRGFGAATSDAAPLSPVVSQINRRVECPVIIF